VKKEKIKESKPLASRKYLKRKKGAGVEHFCGLKKNQLVAFGGKRRHLGPSKRGCRGSRWVEGLEKKGVGRTNGDNWNPWLGFFVLE